MKQLLTLALVLLFAAPAFAEGPIAASIAHHVSAAAAAQASQAAQRTKMKNSGMYLGGLVLSGVGGYMLGYGIMVKKETLCYSSFGITYCEEYGSNKTMLVGGGAAIAGLGFWLAHVGGERVVIAPSLTGVAVKYNWGK